MSDITPLVQLLQQQMEAQQKQHQQQMELLQKQIQQHAGGGPHAGKGNPGQGTDIHCRWHRRDTPSGKYIPSFSPFDPSAELWKDYYARFHTSAGAHTIPEDRLGQVFLTNQTTANYKLLGILPGQQTPPKDVSALTMEDIFGFMEDQFGLT